MKDFLLIFRMNYEPMQEATPEQMQEMTKRWMDWVGEIAEAGKLIDRGNRLENTGRIVKAGGIVTNGPFTDIKESIGGFTMIRAESYDDAVEISKRCPIFFRGGNVEIRQLGVMD